MTRSTDPLFDSRIANWLEDDPNHAPAQVLDIVLAAVPSISQRRRLPVPWRFSLMTNSMRAAAAIAIVAIVGVGVLAFTFRSPGAGTQSPAPTLTPAPTPVAPGITTWTTYTSEVHGFTVGYPADWSVNAPATRKWQPGDNIHLDEWPYADTFISPGQDAVGLFVWEMPAGEGADVESVQGLKVWAESFCNDVGASSCEEFTQRAVPMCLNEGGAPIACRAAILVPTATEQYAFFVNWGTAVITSNPDRVRVVLVAREDSFPSAARYGGSVELLRSILTTMNVWTPGRVPPAT